MVTSVPVCDILFCSFSTFQHACPCFLCVTSVVGPALTFRIRQNEHNMTAAEVAAKAGETLALHTQTAAPTHTHAHRANKIFVFFSPLQYPRSASSSLRPAYKLYRRAWERYVTCTCLQLLLPVNTVYSCQGSGCIIICVYSLPPRL